MLSLNEIRTILQEWESKALTDTSAATLLDDTSRDDLDELEALLRDLLKILSTETAQQPGTSSTERSNSSYNRSVSSLRAKTTLRYSESRTIAFKSTLESHNLALKAKAVTFRKR